MNPIGCNSEQLKDIMKLCGYQVIKLFNGKKLYFLSQNQKNLLKNYKNKSIKKPNKKIKIKN